MPAALGIDIGGTSIKAALLDGGALRWTARSVSYSRPGRDELLAALGRLMADGPPESKTPQYVGLCAPGLLAPDGQSIAVAVNVPGLVGLEFAQLLLSAGILPACASESPRSGVHVVTDAYAAAYDYYQQHSVNGRLHAEQVNDRPTSPERTRVGSDESHTPPPLPHGRGSLFPHHAVVPRLLAISIGTGVGACVLDAGMPLMVTGSGPGHFGQIDVSGIDPSDETVPIGPDGGRGSLEAYIGLPALRSRYGGDLEAALDKMTIAEMPCRALVRVIRVAHALYRPNAIVLLGGVGIRLAKVLDEIRAEAAVDLTSLAREGWTLRCGESDYHAARGAALLAAEASYIF